MNILDLKLIEPYKGKDGVDLIVLDSDGEIHELTSVNWSNGEAYTKTDRKMMRKAASGTDGRCRSLSGAWSAEVQMYRLSQMSIDASGDI